MAEYASNPVSSHPEPVNYRHGRRHHRSSDNNQHGSPSPPMSSGSEEDQPRHESKRPTLATRRTNSTIIIPRDSPNVEMTEEDYGPGDARSMSPRRTSEEVDRLGENARQALLQQAKELQESLSQIVDKVESVKTEHQKLEGGNKFLQSYIGELMQTSKVTSMGAGKGKSRGK